MLSTITPKQLEDLIKQQRPLDLIDVRTPAEFRAVHLQAARPLPLDALDADTVRDTRPPQAEGPCYVLCKSGSRARTAAGKLREAGVEAVIVEGGTDACVAAGLPCHRGKQTMSLERQVRIAAGTLVFLGTILGATLSPWVLLLPGFVGAGLVFAGVTDTCGMGMLLAKMPWNL